MSEDPPFTMPNKPSSVGPDTPPDASRRAFLQGAGLAAVTVAAAGIVGYTGSEKYGWLESFNNNVPIDPAAGDVYQKIDSYTPTFTIEDTPVDAQYERTLTDERYLGWLFRNLSNAPSNEHGEEAIQSALRLVRGPLQDKHGIATATEIDRGGVFITARHVVTEAPLRFIDDPHTNKAHRITAAFIHKDADIAIIIAPTGDELLPSSGIRFASASLRAGEQLHLNGLSPINGTVDTVHRYRKSGKVTSANPAQVAVEGLVPLGGTSGSTICNDSGRVVGVESGFYYRHPNGPNEVSNYAGAIIAPVTLLNDMSKMQRLEGTELFRN